MIFNLYRLRRIALIVSLSLLAGVVAFAQPLPPGRGESSVKAEEILPIQEQNISNAPGAWPKIQGLIDRLSVNDASAIQLNAIELLATNLIFQSHSDYALKFLPQAQRLAQLSGNAAAERHLQVLGVAAAHFVGKTRLSSEIAYRLVDEMRQLNDTTRYAQTLLMLAIAAEDERLPALTLDLIERLKPLFNADSRFANYEVSYWRLYGGVLKQSNDVPGAISAAKRALALARQMQNDWEISIELDRLGQLYEMQRQWSQAQLNFNESYDIAVRLNDAPSMAFAAINLAMVAFKQGTPDNDAIAEKWLNIALPLFTTLEDPRPVVDGYLTLTEIALKHKEVSLAKATLAKTDPYRNTLSGRQLAKYHTVVALIAAAEGHPALAYSNELKASSIRAAADEKTQTEKLAAVRGLIQLSEAERNKQSQTSLQQQAGQRKERDKLQALVNALGIALLMTALVATVWLYKRSVRYRKLSEIDELTGVRSRRTIIAICQQRLRLAKRRSEAFSLAVFDIDGFKLLNDRYGHAAGDTVLKQVVVAISAALGPQYEIGRLGGDEFLIVLPNANEAHACEIAHKICSTARALVSKRYTEWRPTISIGVATQKSKDDNYYLLYAKADKALYVAKAEGRDQFVHAATLGDNAFMTSQMGATLSSWSVATTSMSSAPV